MLRLLPLLFAALVALSSCSGVFYQPDQYMYYPPELFGLKREDIYFFSPDNLGLHGWFFRAEGKPKGTIVQFHGNAENLSSHYTSLVWLVKEGYNLFIFDYRGYGESRGSPSRAGLYHDALGGLDEGWELHTAAGGGKFIVYGQSLGGAVVVPAFLEFKQAASTNLLVLDSTFLSYKTVARRALASHWLTWLFSPLGSLLVSDDYAPEAYVPKLRTKLLVIHDRRDPVVAYANGVEFFREAPEPKEFWEVDNGTHVGIFEGKANQRQRFLEFVNSLH